MNILERIKEKTSSISQARQAEIAAQQNSSSHNLSFYGLVASFFIGYSTLFYLLTQYELPFRTSENLAFSLILFLHAIAIFTASLLYLLGRVNLATYRKILAISIAFFMFSFLMELAYIIAVKEVHFLIMYPAAVLLCITVYRKKYPDLIARGMLSELATPFMCACSLLVEKNQGGTTLYKLMFVMTLITWAIFRVVNFTMIYRTLYKRKASIGEYIAFTPVALMGYYWFGQLLISRLS